MFFAFLFAIGLTAIIAVEETEGTLIAAAMGVGVIAMVSALQYILIAEWHPMYLFRKGARK